MKGTDSAMALSNIPIPYDPARWLMFRTNFTRF
jgi:hypothetical protein